METNVTLESRKQSNETEEHEENASNRLLIENGTDQEFNEIRSTYEGSKRAIRYKTKSN